MIELNLDKKILMFVLTILIIFLAGVLISIASLWLYDKIILIETLPLIIFLSGFVCFIIMLSVFISSIKPLHN